jgi:hypothetical protein
MAAKLLTRKAALAFLGLTEEQVAEMSKVHPFPEPRDICGVPYWASGELYQWALSLPKHGGQAQAQSGKGGKP